MPKQIKIPICPERLQGVKIEPGSSTNSGVKTEVDEETGRKRILISITQNPVPKPARVTIGISSGNHYHCEEEDYFWWEREIDHWDAARGKNVLEDYPTLHMINPDICQWIRSELRLYGPSRCGGDVDETPSHGCVHLEYEAGSGPEGMAGVKYSVQVPQNTIVPGMDLILWHYFTDGKKTTTVRAGSEYWCTCCLTGGRVVGVNGEYGNPEITFDVEIEGGVVECYPTDFVEYAVGDWVFVAKAGGECENTLRTDPCKGGCLEEGGVHPDNSKNHRIIPLRIGQDGA